MPFARELDAEEPDCFPSILPKSVFENVVIFITLVARHGGTTWSPLSGFDAGTKFALELVRPVPGIAPKAAVWDYGAAKLGDARRKGARICCRFLRKR